MGGDFELLGSASDETRLLRDRTSGYSVPLPGHPRLEPAVGGSPTYDVIVRLDDVKAEHGFRRDELPTTADPQALAKALVETYATTRAGTTPRIKPISGSMRPGGVAGGAHAIYRLAEPADDPTMEQLWLLVRPTPTGVQALYHTTRFRTDDLNHVQWAHLRTSIIDKHHWDPEQPRQAAPAIWPASHIAVPSAKLDLTDDAWVEASAKARDIGPLADEQTDALVDILREIAMTDDPPAFELPSMIIELHTRRIAMCGPTRAAEAMLRNLEQCKTALDLRGWAWQCIWAIGNRDERDRSQRTTN
ncbi:MAG: hypothetical protein HOV81_35615 [Kofleriaceae bacterium]|nr:hypothetical protein [Kofleriaceae bacterium]